MKSSLRFMHYSFWLLALGLCSCASHRSSASPGQQAQSASLQPLDPEQIQGRTMSFADRYITSVADAYDQTELNCKTLDGRIMAERCKLYAGLGAMGNAVNPNPVVGMMDMALMVTLTRELSTRPWAIDTFGRANASAITALLSRQETSIWNITRDYLTPEQIRGLHSLAEQWIANHPEQRFVASARLAELSAPSRSGNNNNNPNVVNLAAGVFSLVSIDPFKGLDPAIQQVEQSRILAERAFFYLQHMPMLLSWQTDLLYSQMLANPQTRQLLEDTTIIAGSTTRFTQATSRFTDATSLVADASNRFANTIEHFRQQLPAQQSELMDQLNKIVATQSQAALHQASTQATALTGATVTQLNSTVTAQQDLLNQHLQDVMNSSIDRLYWRLRSLVLIVGATCVGAIVLYKLIAAMFFKSDIRRP